MYLRTGDDGLFVPGAPVTKTHKATQRLDAEYACIMSIVLTVSFPFPTKYSPLSIRNAVNNINVLFKPITFISHFVLTKF